MPGGFRSANSLLGETRRLAGDAPGECPHFASTRSIQATYADIRTQRVLALSSVVLCQHASPIFGLRASGLKLLCLFVAKWLSC